MKITRANELVEYHPKGHYDMKALRAHNKEMSGAQFLIVGLSVFSPQGGAENNTVKPDSELIYYIVEGEMELTTAEGVTVLKSGDSVYFGVGDERSVCNKTDKPAKMLVIMAKKPE